MAPYHILRVIISSVKSAAPNLHISAPLLKRFSCFSRKRTDLPKKELHGVCTLTKVYQYAKEERFLFFEPCRTLVDICMELLLSLKT